MQRSDDEVRVRPAAAPGATESAARATSQPVQPLNVVRMYDGSWQLIDLDGSVRIGLAIGAKDPVL